jgi:hypothetical protein
MRWADPAHRLESLAGLARKQFAGRKVDSQPAVAGPHRAWQPLGSPPFSLRRVSALESGEISRRAECASSSRGQRVRAAKLQHSDHLLTLHGRKTGDEIINRLPGLEMIEQTLHRHPRSTEHGRAALHIRIGGNDRGKQVIAHPRESSEVALKDKPPAPCLSAISRQNFWTGGGKRSPDGRSAQPRSFLPRCLLRVVFLPELLGGLVRAVDLTGSRNKREGDQTPVGQAA